jgi:PAS domain S-box-containing protein
VVGFLAVQRDVTAQKAVEAALRESEHRYRTLSDAARDSIFIVDHLGRVEYANDAGAALFGTNLSGNGAGRQLDDLFPAATAAEMWRELSCVFESGQPQLFEHSFASPRGEIWLEASLVPMWNGAARPHAVMGVARDITQRKILERQFLQAQKMEAVGRLAGGIAHDFNNLLTAILGYSDLLRDRMAELGADAQADLDEIRKAGERASRLTRQLLAFSRKQPMAREVVDLKALTSDIQKMLGRVLGDDIELSIVAADVWPICADPSHIEQVLLNLAVNARDAMAKGGRLTITTANAQVDAAFARVHAGAVPGSYVALTVQDTGCGMSADVLAHVFEPFFTTKPQGQGTGLGLATVYGIVKQNGAYITIDSRPGDGTAVTIYWPKQRDNDVASTRAAAEPMHSANGIETVLLVEDEPDIRGLIRKGLERYGYRVIEARDTSDAVALARSHEGQIDLLLSDVIMPGLNGPDLAQLVVARRPSIRVLYISGFPSAHLPERCEARQRTWFLAKPFTPEQLARRVRQCLDAGVVRTMPAALSQHRRDSMQAARTTDGAPSTSRPRSPVRPSAPA